MRLAELLVKKGVASARQIEEAIAKQVVHGGDLASYLLEQVGADNEAALMAVVAEHTGLHPAPAGALPRPADRVIKLLPGDIAQRHGLYPLAVDGGALVVAVSTPLPEQVEDDLAFALGLPIVQLVAPEVRIAQGLARDYRAPLDRRSTRLLAKLEGRPDPHPSSRPPPLPPGGAVGPKFEQEPVTKPGVGSNRKALPSMSSTQVGMPAIHPPGDPGAAAVAGQITRPLIPSGKTTQVGMIAVRVPPSPPAQAGPAGEGEAKPAAWPVATKGLVRWMRQSSLTSGASAPRSRRRRGPMSAAAAEEALLASVDAEEALAVFFDFAQQFFSYSALFVVQGDLAEGRDAYGPGSDRERVAAVGVTLDLPSCLARARSTGAPVCAPLARDGIDAALASDLGRSPKGSVVVVPITVRRRVVALLYGDDGESAVELSMVGEVLSMASLTGASLERMVVLRKRRKAGDPDPAVPLPGPEVVVPKAPALPVELAPTQAAPALSPPPPPAPPAGQGGPPRTSTLTGIAPVGREQKAEALARALGIAQPEGAPTSALPPTALSPAPTSKRSPSGRPVADPRRDPRAEPDDPPSSTPELTVAEASVDDELLREALASLEEAPSSRGGSSRPHAPTRGTFSGLGPILPRAEAPPSSKAAYQPPRRPPSSTEIRALPAVILDMGDEQTQLVDRLVEEGVDDDELLGHVLREGVKLVPALVSRIPGRLRCSLESLLDGSTRPSAASSVLRALTSLRRTALPFVVVQSANASAGPRTYATLLLGELAYPEAAAAVVPRFFDPEPEARRAALAATRLLRATPELGDSIASALEKIVRDEGEAPERRVIAARTLVDVEPQRAAPALVAALRAGDMRVREDAARVLAELTAQEHGVDASAWEGWLARAGAADRTEWMIDALSHPSPSVRARALAQLRPLMDHTLDGFEALPEPARLEVQAQCRAIWKASDRLMRVSPRAD